MKIYTLIFFDLSFIFWTLLLPYLQNKRFCEFIPFNMNETFSFHCLQIPQGIYFSKNMLSGLGNFCRILAISVNREYIISVLQDFCFVSKSCILLNKLLFSSLLKVQIGYLIERGLGNSHCCTFLLWKWNCLKIKVHRHIIVSRSKGGKKKHY